MGFEFKVVEIVNCWTLCRTTYFISLFRGWDWASLRRMNSTLCTKMEPSRLDKIRDINLVKLLTLLKKRELNARVVRYFQRCFHLLDKTQVWTADFVSINYIMWSRTQSGNWLSLSLRPSLSLLLCLCLFFAITINFSAFPFSIDTWTKKH